MPKRFFERYDDLLLAMLPDKPIEWVLPWHAKRPARQATHGSTEPSAKCAKLDDDSRSSDPPPINEFMVPEPPPPPDKRQAGSQLTLDVADESVGTSTGKRSRPSAEALQGDASRQRPPFRVAQMEVLLVRTHIRNRPNSNGPDDYGQQSSRWGPPKGHMEPSDVSVLSAAIREFQEETGLPVPRTTRETAIDLGVGLCNSSGPKTLQMFAVQAWPGLAEASGGGLSLAPDHESELEVDLMEWWPAARAIAPPWRSGTTVRRERDPTIGIHPPKARFVQALAQHLIGQSVCGPLSADDAARWWPAKSFVATASHVKHSCGLFVYRFVD